jgi:hypothetical protein
VGRPESQKIAAEISDASVVLLQNKNDLLPLNKEARLLAVAVTEDPGWVVGTDLHNELAASLNTSTLIRVSNETGRERFSEIASSSKDYDAVLVGIYLTISAWKGGAKFSKPLQDFLSSLPQLPRPVILVAFGENFPQPLPP